MTEDYSTPTADSDAVRSADEIDPAWMTDVFHRAGVATGTEVVGLARKSIGTGQVGENVRFSLEWASESDDAPASVVGKFPSLDPVSRQGGVMTRTYIRETGFYRDLHSMVDIRTPGILHVGWAPEDDHNFTLIMEDMCNSIQGDQLTGCSIDETEAVIDAAVGLHAPTWGWMDKGLGFDEWLDEPGGEGESLLASMIGLMWPTFAERYDGRISSDGLALGAEVVSRYEALIAAGNDWAAQHNAWSVVHGDYRLDNMLFANAAGAPPVCVVDWQTAAVGVGARDIAYFLSGALAPEQRAEAERDLVARYTNGLESRGIDIAFDDIWDAYVLGSPSCLLMAVFASQAVGRTERGDEMFARMAEGSIAQMRHLGLLDVL